MPSLFKQEDLKASIDKHFAEIEDPRVERRRAATSQKVRVDRQAGLWIGCRMNFFLTILRRLRGVTWYMAASSSKIYPRLLRCCEV